MPCTAWLAPYINKCRYDGAFEALDHLYGGLTRPTGEELTGQFLEYDQLEFYNSSLSSSLDPDGGYIYVPNACAEGGMRSISV